MTKITGVKLEISGMVRFRTRSILGPSPLHSSKHLWIFLVHIFASATMYESFNIALKTKSTDIFLFIRQYVEEGPTKKIYKKRAELLKKVEFFIRNGATSDIIIIDALSNINNLCEQIFNENLSYKIKSTCKCQNSKSRSGIILPVQTKIIEEYGYKKLTTKPLYNMSQKCLKFVKRAIRELRWK